MRNSVVRVAAVVALGLSALAPAGGPAAAADLDYTGQVSPFSCGEPWATVAERPPTHGRWFWEERPAPTVNFIVPCHSVYTRPEPWTPAWVAYCERKWPSFNPKTGYFLSPDGPRRCF